MAEAVTEETPTLRSSETPVPPSSNTLTPRSSPPWRVGRRLVEIVGGIPFATLMLSLIFLYGSVGSALPPVRQGALADLLGVETLRFEKSEMQWFCWWPFHVLVGMFCAGLVVATLRHVPLRRDRAGVLAAHLGVLLLAACAAAYFYHKKEGDTVIFAARALILAPGMDQPASLVVRPEARTRIGVDPWLYDIRIDRIVPDDRVPAGPDQGRPTASIWLSVSSARPARQFTRVLYLGYPGATRDLAGHDGDSASAGHSPVSPTLIDPDLQIQLDYDPAGYFYYSHQPPVHSVGAIYARFAPTREWTQIRLHGLPHYYEYLSNREEVRTATGEPLPPPRRLDVRVDQPGEDTPLAGLSFEVTDFLPYARPEARWVAGGSDFQPLLRFTLGPMQEVEPYELLALAPMASRLMLAEGLEARFVWASSPAESEALIPAARPELIVRHRSAGLEERLPLAALAAGEAVRITGTDTTLTLQKILPAGMLMDGTSPAMVILRVEVGGERFTRVVLAGRAQSGPDVDERLQPLAGSGHPDLEFEYRNPIVPQLLFIGRPDSDRLEVFWIQADGTTRHYQAAEGSCIELAEGLTLRILTCAGNARRENRPTIVPSHRRHSLQEVGKSMSMIRVAVRSGGEERVAWLPFSPYAFDDDQRAQPGRFPYEPVRLPLADGRVLELLYSRWRDPLPAAVALDRFILRTWPGGDRPSDYISLIRFREGDDWSPLVEVRSNEPAARAGWWFFQAQWDPGSQCHTVLGIANREYVGGMLAGALLSIAGIVWAFYVQPGLGRGGAGGAGRGGPSAAAGTGLPDRRMAASVGPGAGSAGRLFACTVLAAVLSPGSRALATEGPDTPPVSTASSRSEFVRSVRLEAFGLVAVQHDGRLKTLDTLARETLRKLSGRTEFDFDPGDGRPPIRQSALFTLLDMYVDPEAYRRQRIIHVRRKPVRQAILQAARGPDPASPTETAGTGPADRDGRVSLELLARPEVRARLEAMSRDILRTAAAVDELIEAARLTRRETLEPLLRLVPPPGTTSEQRRWFTLSDAAALDEARGHHDEVQKSGRGSLEEMAAVGRWWKTVEAAWRAGDAPAVNVALAGLSERLAALAPAVYPPAHKRLLEHWYYRTHKMTWVWVVYLAAVIPLMMGAVYAWPRARRIGLYLFIVAFGLHTAAAGVRWYLAGRIPNTNMFEAITAAAWLGGALALLFAWAPALAGSLVARRAAWWAAGAGLGTFLLAVPVQWAEFGRWQTWGPLPVTALIVMTVGIAALLAVASLERRQRGYDLLLLGAAVVGMVVMMCGRFMTVSLNSDIGQPMPVLNDLWLYIHVNMIIAAYALIGIAFVTAAMYVVGRLLVEPSPGLWLTMGLPTAAIPLLVAPTGLPLGTILPAWLPFAGVVAATLLAAGVRQITPAATRQRVLARWQGGPAADPPTGPAGLAQILDGTTMLLMELAFLTLWTGLILGAVWADHSWGRPWGWDPKEVFALNTWIIFLILVHIRLRVRDKALWTAVLAVIGCAVMLFNWIVVNFFITGLHSYA